MLNRRNFVAAIAVVCSPLSLLFAKKPRSPRGWHLTEDGAIVFDEPIFHQHGRSIDSEDLECRSVTFVQQFPAVADTSVMSNNELVGMAANVKREGESVVADLYILGDQIGIVLDPPARVTHV